MRLILLLILALFTVNQLTYAQDSTKLFKQEVGLAYGKVFPSVQTLNKNYYAKPEIGNYYALNLDFVLKQLSKRSHLSLGGRGMLILFKIQEIYPSKYYSGGVLYIDTLNYNGFAGELLVGTPIRFNYTIPCSKKISIRAGIGLYPCFSLESFSPFRFYGEAFGGFCISEKYLLSATFLKTAITTVKAVHAEYNVTGVSLDFRYIFIKKRKLRSGVDTTNKIMRPKYFH